MAFRKLPAKFIGIATATAIAGPTIGIVDSSNLPAPIRRGTSALIGTKLLTGSLRTLRFRR